MCVFLREKRITCLSNKNSRCCGRQQQRFMEKAQRQFTQQGKSRGSSRLDGIAAYWRADGVPVTIIARDIRSSSLQKECQFSLPKKNYTQKNSLLPSCIHTTLKVLQTNNLFTSKIALTSQNLAAESDPSNRREVGIVVNRASRVPPRTTCKQE